jgi:VCBS repeat-containing protein
VGPTNEVAAQTLAVVAVTQPSHGSVTFTAAGVTYTPARDFFGVDTFTYTVSDGQGGTATASVTVTVTPVNDAPVVSVTPVPLTYPENTGPVVVDAGLTISDVDNTSLAGATVAVTNYQAGEDVLAFTQLGNITGSFDTLTGVLTLTGADTLANYQAALRTVTYANTSDNPSAAPRTVRFVVTDGADPSLAAARPVTVVPANDAPVLTAPAALTVLEDANLAVTGVSVADPDAGAANVKVTLAVAHGTLTVATGVGGGLTAGQVSGNGTGAVVLTGPVAAINATLAAAGGLTYRAATDYNGADTLAIGVDDLGNAGTGGALTAARTVALTVTSVNDAPQGASKTVTTDEDVAYVFQASDFGFTDPSDSPANALKAVKVTTLPAAGTLLLNGAAVAAGQSVLATDVAAGKLSFLPAANANGAGYASFTFQVQDDGGTANGGVDLDPTARTLTVNVTPVNDAPVATADARTMAEDGGPTAVAVLANDTDVENDTLSVVAVTQPANGAVTFTPAGVSYTPAPDFFGTDTFTYTESDGHGGTATATVTVTVTPVNDAPVAGNGTAATLEDTPRVVDQTTLASVVDTPASGLSYPIVTAPAHGTLTPVAGQPGKYTYSPAANYSGTDTFTFKVNDGSLDSANRTVTITVTEVNDAPVANPDSYTLQAASLTVPAATGVLANDTDADGDPRSVAGFTQPAHGTATVAGTGSFTYTPAVGFYGTDAFTYTVADGRGGSATGTVTVAVSYGVPRVNLVGTDRLAVGAGAGGGPVVQTYNRLTAGAAFYAGPAGFTGGVRVSTGDVNGDGVADVVAVPGPGTAVVVRIFDGATGQEIRSFAGFEPSFLGGAFVAVADFNHDRLADIAISADVGGGPRVIIFDGQTGATLTSFFGIDDPNFRGGARIAAGDLNGDGWADLMVGAGAGGGPRVAGFDGRTLLSAGRTKLFNDIFVFEQSLTNGVYLAVGDVDGDGKADLIAGGGPGGGPRIRVLSGAALSATGAVVVVANFFAGDEGNRGGVRLAVKDLDGDNKADIVTGTGDGAGSRVRVVLGSSVAAGNPTVSTQFDPFADLDGGIYVG